jgi:hypothetical protein
VKKFASCDGLMAPFDRANVDTDALIPKQFLKSIKRSGLGSISLTSGGIWITASRESTRPNASPTPMGSIYLS